MFGTEVRKPVLFLAAKFQKPKKIPVESWKLQKILA